MLINEIIIGLGDIAMSAEKRSLLVLFLALIAVASIGVAIPSRSGAFLSSAVKSSCSSVDRPGSATKIFRGIILSCDRSKIC